MRCWQESGQLDFGFDYRERLPWSYEPACVITMWGCIPKSTQTREKCVSVFVWGCIDNKETGVRCYVRCSPWWWLRVGGRVRGSPLITKATQMMLYAGERTSGNQATSKESIGILVPCLESDLTSSMFNNLSISEGFWNYNLIKGHRQLRQTERGLIRSFTTYKLYELLNVVCFSFSVSFWRYQLYQSAWLQ